LKTVGKILSTIDSPALVYSKDSATEANLRDQDLDDYRVLYFATHGLLPGELKCQTEPGLVMTPPLKTESRENDGLLEASEIASLRINADIVVLSACNTAGSGGKFGGDALSGLAEAFFYAGARSLVVSHWQVPSKATANLMSAMFESLGPNLKTGAALSLRDAQKSLIGFEKTAHPFFWAAFVVVGDGIDESWLPLPREIPKYEITLNE
jgi:CHAT domain-containing protein